MKIQVTQESPVKKKIEVAIGAEIIQEHIDAAYNEIGKTAKLKGFRPGKAPRPILQKYYQHDAEDKAIRSIIDATYPEALEQEDLHPLSYPEIQIDRFDPSKELVYQAQFEVKPEIAPIQGYKTLKIKKKKIEVAKQELDERIKYYQEHQAKLVPIEPARPLKQGDVAIFDYEALRDGEAFEGNKVDNYMAELGSGVLLKDFEENMAGMNPGDNKVIEVTLPEDFADKQFAGKKMTYTVMLKEIKEKIVPKLDADFAKDLGHENLEAFKEACQAEIQGAKERTQRAEQHREVVETLLKSNEIPAPDSMLESELSAMYDQLRQNLQPQGQTPEALGMTQEKFREQNLSEAQLRVQGMLLFEKIWTDEGIVVTEEDREQKLETLSQLLQQQKLTLRQYYDSHPERMGQLDVLILQDKTLDFILSGAKIESK